MSSNRKLHSFQLNHIFIVVKILFYSLCLKLIKFLYLVMSKTFFPQLILMLAVMKELVINSNICKIKVCFINFLNDFFY